MIWNNLELPDKPYYQDEWVVIYHADCRDILPLIPDKSVDLVLTDPPYGLNLDLQWLSQMNLAQGSAPNKADEIMFGDDGNLDLSFIFNYPRWLIFGFPYILSPQATGWLVWDKQPGFLSKNRTVTTPIEMALTNCWVGFRLIRCMWVGYMRDTGEYRYAHPTQKPIKVIDYCFNQLNEQMLWRVMPCYLRAEFDKAQVTQGEIAKLFPSKSGGVTGCVSNWLNGYNFPTESQYEIIRKYLKGNKGGHYLSRDYQDIRSNEYRVSIKENAIILDPFLGSGTTCYCAKKLNRYSIGIEIAAKRCSQSVMMLDI